MRLRSRATIVLTMLLAGCGGRATAPAGFINHTKHSDAELVSLWRTAQQNLSEQIDLNPLEQELNNAAPQIFAGRCASMERLFASASGLLSDGRFICRAVCRDRHQPA